MTILESLHSVAMNIEATAQSMKDLSQLLQEEEEREFQFVNVGTTEQENQKPEYHKTDHEKKGIEKELVEEQERQKQTVTIEQVRAVLAEKSQVGLSNKVKDLLESFGVKKLSAVSEKDYSDLLEAAKKLKG